MPDPLLVIGAGLAGCEAALAAAAQGVPVLVREMKPLAYTPAHHSPLMGELVCSNSLRSDDPTSAVGLLKLEMSLLGSAVMRAARATAVGAGKALAVDRQAFAALLDQALRGHPLITLESVAVAELPREGLCVLASGPLTTPELAADLARLTGQEGLHFYDAIAPIVSADSVDMAHAFWADRYADGEGDYLNCPLSKEEWQAFYQALTTADQVPLKDFENPRFFEGCLPIEVMAGRGEKTLLFGPMKPVGLVDPATGRRPHAVVQLRKEDHEGRLLNLVGFQTKLTHPAQERVFRLIPALASCEFARLGSIHRNTFIDAPRVLTPDLRLVSAPQVYVAGQLSGVEGYVESAASGLLCGLNAGRRARGLEPLLPPPTTALGGLLGHLGNTVTKDFQPSNVNMGLLPPLPPSPQRLSKKQRGVELARRALADLLAWMEQSGLTPAMQPPSL
ncbi:MAG: methylenetetrahydrofolate--tRNA-(uracil(54)-C(5))-methyltransferase (FADH(2)-oxidizing) TrmFO [Desulfarculus sp.]|nr:methylenetetrahydrofolate--tRNA-(uracil(54)-C(5))-methyltransferase (FADH(2)-oxidizing) TrmFO [Desulfarculus sp.]